MIELARGTSPLRVGYVVKRYPRYSETFVVNEILAHEEAGLEVTLFSLYPTNDTHFQDLLARVRAPVVHVNADGLKALELWQTFGAARTAIPGLDQRLVVEPAGDVRVAYQALRVATEARRRGLDLLHAHFATVATSVARQAAALAELPYSFTAHAKDLFHQSVSLDDLRAKVRDAAAVVTVSDFNRAWLAETVPGAAEHIVRVYNGLPLEELRFEPRPAPRGRPTILSVGRLIEKKGFGLLVEACARLVADGVDLDCAIVGTGELEGELAAQIARLGLGERVELAGARPRGEVLERMRRAAAFAGCYVVGEDGNRDGLPTVLIEAMAVGTPCVASAVTGVPEAVLDGETGLLVPPGDVGALAAAMRRVLEEPGLGTRLARAARRHVEARFDVRKNAAEQRALFAAVVDRRRAGLPRAAGSAR